MNITRTRSLDQISTFVTSLVAARQEEDGTIQLLVADPAEPASFLPVILPDVAPAAPGAAARSRFIESVGMPSFEGYTLLYGEARLTVVRPSPAFCRVQDAGVCTCLHVMELELLDAPVRPAADHGDCPKQSQRVVRTCVGARPLAA
jgi:hypothetical protein